jgi:ureidoglycolate lyase
MVAIGEEPISFVVVQFANGVDIEDCQEAELDKQDSGGLSVDVPSMKPGRLSKL